MLAIEHRQGAGLTNDGGPEPVPSLHAADRFFGGLWRRRDKRTGIRAGRVSGMFTGTGSVHDLVIVVAYLGRFSPAMPE
jgi:hypothetical protein